MRTQVIRLEIHDDFLSTRDKMNWAKAPRLILVLPKRGRRILAEKLDFVLLQRHAQSLGSQLALVTRLPEIRDTAEQTGIAVFPSVMDAQKATSWGMAAAQRSIDRTSKFLQPGGWRATRDELTFTPARWESNPWWRLLIFSIGVLPIVIMAMMFLPSAEVRITPAVLRQSIDLEVVPFDEEGFATVTRAGTIPLRTMHFIITVEDSINATGKVYVPQGFARGVVQFINLTDQPIVIPVGLIVRTLDAASVRFMVTRQGSLMGKAGDVIELPVQALKPGSAGNVATGSIRGVEGELGVALAVSNTEPLNGGFEQEAPAPSRSDYDHLQQMLLQKSSDLALGEIRKRLLSGDILIDNALKVEQVISEDTSPQTGQPADQMRMQLQVEYACVYLAGQDLENLFESVFANTIPAGYLPVRNTLVFSQVNKVIQHDTDEIIYQISGEQLLQAIIPEARVPKLIMGMSNQKAIQKLQNTFDIIEPVQVELSPGWWPALPLLPFRIQTRIIVPGEE